MGEILKTLWDNAYVAATGKAIDGETNAECLCPLALMRLDRVTAMPSLKGIPPLERQERREAKAFYSPYVRFISDRYHRIYKYYSGGKFFPEYLPEDFFFIHVDPYFNDRKESHYIDNKCYYPQLFPGFPQPEIIVKRLGKIWTDGENRLVPPKGVLELIREEPEIVVKKAVNSQRGFGVFFISGEEKISKFKALIRDIKGDIAVQRPVKQHEILADLHPESVNTLRIVSLLTGDSVKICRTMIRIGRGKDRIDNGSYGGVVCGVDETGQLGSHGVLHSGKMSRRHPDLKYLFSEKRIPFIDRAFSLVKAAHPLIPHFRLVAWDIGFDTKGEPVIIEVNLTLASISNIQALSGPLFGEDTKDILDEVFRGKNRRLTILI